MAAALSSHPDLSSSDQHPDSSNHSFSGPDFTLGSLTSAFSTPHKGAGGGKLRVPGATSRNRTPSPGTSATAYATSSRASGLKSLDEEESFDFDAAAGQGNETGGGDLLGTPAVEKKGRGRSGTLTANNGISSNSKLSKLTLRDQEKVRLALRAKGSVYLSYVYESISTTSRKKTSISSFASTFLRTNSPNSPRTRWKPSSNKTSTSRSRFNNEAWN